MIRRLLQMLVGGQSAPYRNKGGWLGTDDGRLLQMLFGGQSPYRNKWERMSGEPCQPPARERNGRAWPTSPPPPPPPKRQEGQQ